MAALEGTFQRFQSRQSVGVTLPVIESREIGARTDISIENFLNPMASQSENGSATLRGSSSQLEDNSQRSGSRLNQRPRSRGDMRTSTPGTPDRPSSALARGVSITEHSDPKVNPEPVLSEEADILLEEYLSPRKLRALTGVEDLDQVHYLEMKVDTRDTSLGNFGSHLPNLSQLKLSNSIISTIRDLGSSLDALKVLWMARCGVEDLDGLHAMTSLRELYLAYNEITDISPCSMLDNLQILDLEGNNVDDMSQVHFLSLCSALESLTLEGNPVCVTPSPDTADPKYDYRETVKSVVPQIKILDDVPLVANKKTVPSKTKSSISEFQDDWKLIQEMLDEGLVLGAEDDVELDVPARPGTSFRPTTGYRPGSALKPYTALTGVRPNSRAGARSDSSLGAQRPLSGNRTGSSDSSRPTTASNRVNSADGEDDTSDLTMGGVVCGNPAKALRTRKATKPSTLQTSPKLLAELKQQKPPEKPYSIEMEEDEELKQLFLELKKWKEGHLDKKSEIEASKAPQILKIHHDDEEADASGNEVSTDEEDCAHKSRVSSSKEDDRLIAFTGARPKHVRPKKSSQKRFKSPTSRRFDESHKVQDDDLTPESTPPTPPDRGISRINGHRSSTSSLHSLKKDEARPVSGSEPVGSRKIKFSTPPDKSLFMNEKSIDKANPVIRASTLTPERVMDTRPPRYHQPTQLSRIRKGHLANVELLPSRYPKHKDDEARK